MLSPSRPIEETLENRREYQSFAFKRENAKSIKEEGSRLEQRIYDIRKREQKIKSQLRTRIQQEHLFALVKAEQNLRNQKRQAVKEIVGSAYREEFQIIRKVESQIKKYELKERDCIKRLQETKNRYASYSKTK